MKAIFILTIFATIALQAEPKGSTHDAWSDWILDRTQTTEDEEEIGDNSEDDASDVDEIGDNSEADFSDEEEK